MSKVNIIQNFLVIAIRFVGNEMRYFVIASDSETIQIKYIASVFAKSHNDD